MRPVVHVQLLSVQALAHVGRVKALGKGLGGAPGAADQHVVTGLIPDGLKNGVNLELAFKDWG